MSLDGARLPGQQIRRPALQTALALAQRLTSVGIRFAHWKSNSHLAEALCGKTDIDMLVDPAQRTTLRLELKRFGAARVISQPWSTYPDVEDWLILDAETGRFLHIHLHFAMMTGIKHIKHLRILWNDALLSSATRDDASGWPIPSPEMELIVLLVRIWAKMPPLRRFVFPRIPEHIRAEFFWLSSRCRPEELTRLCTMLLPDVDAQRVVAVAECQASSDREIISVARSVYDPLRGAYRMSWGSALIGSAILAVRAWATKKLRKLDAPVVTGKTLDGPGIVIAFIGSDGSGKSTVTAVISRWLRYKLDVHHYYLGSGDGGGRLQDRLRRLLKGLRKNMKANSARPGREKTVETLKEPVQLDVLRKFVALHHLLLMRGKLRMLRTAHRLAACGSIAIMDRFPQSQILGIYDGPRLQNGRSFDWAARAEMKAFEAAEALQPHLLIKLIVSPETAYRRKSDHNLATMKLKCEITQALTFRNTRVIELDAEQSLENVILAAKLAVWETILVRSERRQDGGPKT